MPQTICPQVVTSDFPNSTHPLRSAPPSAALRKINSSFARYTMSSIIHPGIWSRDAPLFVQQFRCRSAYATPPLSRPPPLRATLNYRRVVWGAPGGGVYATYRLTVESFRLIAFSPDIIRLRRRQTIPGLWRLSTGPAQAGRPRCVGVKMAGQLFGSETVRLLTLASKDNCPSSYF